MTDKTNTPVEMPETSLDEISGGPHWQTWDPPTYLAATGDGDGATRESSGHYTQMAWSKTR